MDTSSNKQDAAFATPIDMTLLPDETSKKFVSDLVARHSYHTGLAKDLNRRYKRWSPFLLIFIPLYSATVSFFASGVIASRTVLGIMSLVLTIATILNSTLKPDEKFVSSANVLVKLKDWEADFALSLTEINNDDRKELKTLLLRKNSELSEIGSSMARTYLPLKNG